MSLSSTSTLKAQLQGHLGGQAGEYFLTLKQFISGRTSRTEFEEAVRSMLDSPSLIQLHNALIISLFDATTHKRPPSPTIATTKPPLRKRRRVLPYQGATDDLSLRSSRLKRWALSVGKSERERLKSFHSEQRDLPLAQLEPAVTLLPERGDPPGSRLPVHLAATAGMPTVQHIADRINLICAQNNLGAPNRAVPSLMNLACEAMLKQLLTHALTLTASSQTITSITPRAHTRTHPVLTTASFTTLFTISPADLPTKSAAALRIAFTADDRPAHDPEDDVPLLKDREVRDQRWQILALLAERSTVRDVLSGAFSHL